MSTELNKIMSSVWCLSEHELKEVRETIDDLLSKIQRKNQSNIRTQLRPGVRCKVNHPKGLGKVFVITKVNRTRVKAYVEGSPGLYGNYTIPISLLEIIG